MFFRMKSDSRVLDSTDRYINTPLSQQPVTQQDTSSILSQPPIKHCLLIVLAATVKRAPGSLYLVKHIYTQVLPALCASTSTFFLLTVTVLPNFLISQMKSSFAALSLVIGLSSARTLTVKNNCGFTVWPAVVSLTSIGNPFLVTHLSYCNSSLTL